LDDLISSGEFLDEASQMSRAVSGGNLVRKTSKRQRKDGSLIDLEIVGVPVTVAGKNIGILGLYHDISPRKEAEAALRDRESRFRSLFNQSPISLWEEDFSEVKRILDKIGDKEQIIHELNRDYELVTKCVEAVKIINVNQATLDLYNASSSDELTNNLSEIFVIESLDEFRKEILALVNGETTFECEIYNKKLNGELIYGWLKLSLPPGYEDSWERVQISILDITERKEVEEKLRYMSFHDVLTGLYNRAYFEEELERLSGSRQYPVSIIACDLDGLKQINDEFGHDTGDKAIKAAARVLDLGTFRKEDVVARIGGDEFVIILPFVDLNKTPSILDRIIDSISQYNNSSLDDDLYRPISLSLGHAVVEKGEDLYEGYKSADRAMYASKIKKKGRGSQ
jgi:diguanylate cyclase (GGDEF)-like protein